MSVVLGIDFGTLNVRATVFDDAAGRLGTGIAPYPLHRKKDDPHFATQSHRDHLSALIDATHQALANSKTDGTAIKAIAIDTTGSSVVIVDESIQPLDDYYLWCDHRAWREADEITATAQRFKLDSIAWCGGVYSSEWGFSKVLHWLRSHPEKRHQFASAFEHCDMIAGTLCGITNLDEMPRSICSMGHKWMWNESLGGLPPEDFFNTVDPLLSGVRAAIARGRYLTAGVPAGALSAEWAKMLGLSAGIPVSMGALDAHWDAVGSGIQLGDAVNVIGTSTCIIAMSKELTLVPGVCGVVPGSVHPGFTGIEAGLSATGDIFEAIAKRATSTVDQLSKALQNYRAGQTGLLRLTWDNGDRTILVDPQLSGITLGWNLLHTPEDELFAAMEGTAFHTRIILEHMQTHGASIRRIINGGGIPRKNSNLNQIYANVMNKPVLVPQGDTTGLGAAIFAFVTAGIFPSVEEAQQALCPEYHVFEPQAGTREIYEELFQLFRNVYFAFGSKTRIQLDLTSTLRMLRKTAEMARAH